MIKIDSKKLEKVLNAIKSLIIHRIPFEVRYLAESVEIVVDEDTHLSSDELKALASVGFYYTGTFFELSQELFEDFH